MKRLLFWTIILLLAVWAGIFIQANPGYVLIVLNHISIETTLWVAILAILLLYLALTIVFKIINGTLHLTQRFQNWLIKRRQRTAQQLTNKGLYELAEGDWKVAEKALAKAANQSQAPLINYLAAARAAQGQGDVEQRDYYLKQAAEIGGATEVAVGLTQAELQLDSEQLEQALATLCHLKQLIPQHPYILKLLQRVYLQLHDYQNLAKLLPELKRYKILKPQELEKLTVQIYQHQLHNAANNIQQLEKQWQQLPKHYQQHPKLVYSYANALMQQQQHGHAEELIKHTLKKQWDRELVQLYGFAQSDKPAKQLARAESWLKQHHNDPNLLLTTARLAIREKLWGKAKTYLQSCLNIMPNAEVYFELGRLNEILDETEAARENYRMALVKIFPHYV